MASTPLDSLADILGISQVAEDRFDAVVGIQFAGAAGIGGVDEAADRMPRIQQAYNQIGADTSGAAGDQNLHQLSPVPDELFEPILPRAAPQYKSLLNNQSA